MMLTRQEKVIWPHSSQWSQFKVHDDFPWGVLWFDYFEVIGFKYFP